MRLSALLVVFALVAAPTTPRAQQPLTARDVVARIKQNIGVPWTEPTVDTFKDGDPATPVTGVAVTKMATVDVVQGAAGRGADLVNTHQPTVYDHLDKIHVRRGGHRSVSARQRKVFRQESMMGVWLA